MRTSSSFGSECVTHGIGTPVEFKIARCKSDMHAVWRFGIIILAWVVSEHGLVSFFFFSVAFPLFFPDENTTVHVHYIHYRDKTRKGPGGENTSEKGNLLEALTGSSGLFSCISRMHPPGYPDLS